MKTNFLLSALFTFAGMICFSQGPEKLITGNYTGTNVWSEILVTTIKVKGNHQYTLKTCAKSGKLQKRERGFWNLEGGKLVLIEKSGVRTVLEKYKDLLYTPKNGYTYEARFYHNLTVKDYRKYARSKGC
jgi:hypothetical protein